MKKTLIVFLLLLLTSMLIAEELSTKKALFLSAVLPGLGEMYAKSYQKTATFFCVEAATIFSYLRLKDETQWATNSYKQFAFANANIPTDRDDSYYQIIQNYQSSENYNTSIIRDARNFYLIYKNDPQAYQDYLDEYLVPEDMQWDWETEREWTKYKKLRRNKQDLEIYTKFTFAAAILNRIVSMIDAAVTVNKINSENQLQGHLHIDPDWQKRGIKLYYEYNF